MFDTLNTLDDVQRLIDAGFRESETLDYKRAAHELRDGDHKDVAKDVSAFANSVGGLIIYGVATASDDKTRPERLEAIAPRNVEIIQQVIASTIARPIRGIRVKPVPRQGTAVALLVDVPASEDAPHQNLKDNKYYRRNGPVSQPMPHDLVEMYFGRRLGPRMELTYSLQGLPEISPEGFSATQRLWIQCQNLGARVARHLLIQLSMPVVEWFEFRGIEPASAFTCRIEESVRTCSYLHHQQVLHPELAVTVELRFRVRDGYVRPDLPLVWVNVFAEEMRSVRRRVTLTYDEAQRLSVAEMRNSGDED